jgi:hypothetical protein
MVAAPLSVRVLALDEGRWITVDWACESVGSASDLQRSLYQVTGAVEWQHPELVTWQIRCASQDASEESFLVDGKLLSSMLTFAHHSLGCRVFMPLGAMRCGAESMAQCLSGARWMCPKARGVRMQQRALAGSGFGIAMRVASYASGGRSRYCPLPPALRWLRLERVRRRRVSSVSLGCLLFGSPYQRWRVVISSRALLIVALRSTVLPKQDYRSPSLALIFDGPMVLL